MLVAYETESWCSQSINLWELEMQEVQRKLALEEYKAWCHCGSSCLKEDNSATKCAGFFL